VATLTRPDRETRAAELFHALSDPIRLRVVALLRGGERCVCELTDELELAQSRLSWHLKTLKDAGFLTDRREGRWVYYTLDPSTIAGAVSPPWWPPDLSLTLEFMESYGSAEANRRAIPLAGMAGPVPAGALAGRSISSASASTSSPASAGARARSRSLAGAS